MKYDIIGSNSKLFKKLTPFLTNVGRSFRHAEIKGNVFENPIIFAFNKKSLEENIKFLNEIINSSNGRVIYISTSAIYSNNYTTAYSYPRIKKEIENYLIQRSRRVHIIRVGLVEDFFDYSKFHGPIKYSSINLLCSVIDDLIMEKSSLRISEAWELRELKNSNTLRKALYGMLGILKDILGSYFHLTRPLDLILKLLGEQNYGYTYLSNHFEIHSKHSIVGSGMAALGTLKGIEEKNGLKKTRLIHSKTSNIKYFESGSSGKPIESLSNGGNSNLWHSVISRFLYEENINQASSKFFSELFPNSAKTNELDTYSFIPFFPIRPLKKIQKKKKELKELVDDTILYVEKDMFDNVHIHGSKSSYTTENLFLCTGSVSSLKLLSDSNIIETSTSTLSEHLVGYFGQFKGPLNENQIVLTREGHFKRFHEIKLDKRSLYITLRPANFDFKNLEKANEFRNFFGRNSKSIITSLFTKFNLGLILEALYNKFGLELNLSGTYNIVGHIESKSTVNIELHPFKSPEVTYKEKKIQFSHQDVKLIKQYLKKIGITGTITINEKTCVSPGLHFLKSNLKDELLNTPKGIKLYSTILFDNESPKHPTFDLYVSSYLNTINSLK